MKNPLFGQVGAAQGHLIKQKVSEGDIFLFFGWFRPVETELGDFKYSRGRRIFIVYLVGCKLKRKF